MSEQTASILVYVGLDRFGDGLMKLPFCRALRSTWPDAHITWLAGKGETVYAGRLKDLIAGLIDEVIENAGIGRAAAELLHRPLPDRSFDLILDTQRRAMTSLVLKRIRHRRFISGTAGWLLSDARPPRRGKPPAMIRQMLDLIEAASGRRVEPRRARVALSEAIERQAATLLPDGPPYVAGGNAGRWSASSRSATAWRPRSSCSARTRPSGMPSSQARCRRRCFPSRRRRWAPIPRSRWRSPGA